MHRCLITIGAPRDLVDERTATKHGDGQSFAFDFYPVEAVFVSFAGERPAAHRGP